MTLYRIYLAFLNVNSLNFVDFPTAFFSEEVFSSILRSLKISRILFLFYFILFNLFIYSFIIV